MNNTSTRRSNRVRQDTSDGYGPGMTILIDPTDETEAGIRPRSARLSSLDGATVGLLDISKARGNIFLDRVAQLLTARGATVRRYAKPTFARPAPPDLRARIAEECGAVIEALAD